MRVLLEYNDGLQSLSGRARQPEGLTAVSGAICKLQKKFQGQRLKVTMALLHAHVFCTCMSSMIGAAFYTRQNLNALALGALCSKLHTRRVIQQLGGFTTSILRSLRARGRKLYTMNTISCANFVVACNFSFL